MLPPGYRPEDWSSKGWREFTPSQMELARKLVAKRAPAIPEVENASGQPIACFNVATDGSPTGLVWMSRLVSEDEAWRAVLAEVVKG